MNKTWKIGIYACGGDCVATYEIEANTIETARELAWDLFIQESYADEIED